MLKKTENFLKKVALSSIISDSATQPRKRRQACYRKISVMYGRKYAAFKAKRVTTYCRKCENEPPMCLKCFKYVHKKNKISSL
jgi:hypothetical protein